MTNATSKTTTIAVDAMGGYAGPEPVVRAVGRLSLQFQADRSNAYFVLVGDETRLGELLVQTGHNPERISVVHAEDALSMADPARVGLAEHPHASIARACEVVASGEADAVVTTGHPGGAVVSAFRHFAMIPGVEKGALATVFPTFAPGGVEEDAVDAREVDGLGIRDDCRQVDAGVGDPRVERRHRQVERVAVDRQQQARRRAQEGGTGQPARDPRRIGACLHRRFARSHRIEQLGVLGHLQCGELVDQRRTGPLRRPAGE